MTQWLWHDGVSRGHAKSNTREKLFSKPPERFVSRFVARGASRSTKTKVGPANQSGSRSQIWIQKNKTNRNLIAASMYETESEYSRGLQENLPRAYAVQSFSIYIDTQALQPRPLDACNDMMAYAETILPSEAAPNSPTA